MNSRRRILVVSAAVVALVCILLFFRLREPGRLKLPAGNHVPQISLGSSHGLVIAPDGTLWSWGGEDLGRPVLGYGQTNGVPAFSPLLRRIDSGSNWVKISAAMTHNLALKSDGTIWAWGENNRGQFGNGATAAGFQSSPIPAAPGNEWMQIGAGHESSYALKKDGTLWAWGSNNYRQLGIGTAIDSSLPVQIGSSTNWTKIRAGTFSAAGIQADGSVWTWGLAPESGWADPNSTNTLAFPVRLSAETTWVDASVIPTLWLAVKSDGTLWGFGKMAHLFTGEPASAYGTPVQIGTATDWASVSGFQPRARDGSFWSLERYWMQDHSQAVRLDLPTNAVGGESHSGGSGAAAITRDGEVRAWGVVLGETTARQRMMELFNKIWSKTGPTQREQVRRDQPWSVRNIEPDDPPK